MKPLKFTLFVIVILANIHLLAQPTALPLIAIEAMEFQGAFVIPHQTYGESSANYAKGAMAYNSSGHSLFLSGHSVDAAVGEFFIPNLINSTAAADLNEATIRQNFRKILNLTPDGNPQAIDKVSGLMLFGDELIVHGVEYYDAPANNTQTTLVINEATDIANSAIRGYYEYEGAAHMNGWMSPIPTEWQGLLGGEYLSGSSSKWPINTRLATGVSAFVFDPSALSGPPNEVIPTTTLLDFSLATPLYADYDSYQKPYYNLTEVNGSTHSGHTFEDADAIVGDNDLWTETSETAFGFIVPGTRTYFTIGASGGHNSGIGYKATQNNGNLCGGPCPYDAADYYNYYWLWDVNDLLAVKNGTMAAHDVRPYDYGLFDAPFQIDDYTNTPEFHPISGGTYDPVSGLLYLSIFDGASVANQYAKTPAIAVYNFNINILPVQWIEPLQVKKEGSKVKLNWSVLQEADNYYFEIEHSIDAQHFTAIGQIAADHGDAEKSYRYYHKQPNQGVNYYRIRQFDMDGHATYSNIAHISIGRQKTIEVHPNPVGNTLFLKDVAFDKTHVQVYNVFGQLIYAGLYASNGIDFSIIQPGLYYLRIEQGGRVDCFTVVHE